jgi:hypothetical protein
VVCHRWTIPFEGVVKVNWNAAIDIHNKNMSIDVIVCDLIGEALATLQSPNGNITDPAVAKSVAVLQAFIFAKEMWWNKVELEGDALYVVQVLWKEGQN